MGTYELSTPVVLIFQWIDAWVETFGVILRAIDTLVVGYIGMGQSLVQFGKQVLYAGLLKSGRVLGHRNPNNQLEMFQCACAIRPDSGSAEGRSDIAYAYRIVETCRVVRCAVSSEDGWVGARGRVRVTHLLTWPIGRWRRWLEGAGGLANWTNPVSPHADSVILLFTKRV
jgi:hypothetical protein